MDTTNQCWLVMNQASGSNTPDAAEKIKAALDLAGIPASRVVAVPDDDLPDGADLDAEGVGLLVIYTGDGTLRSALTGLEGWGGAVLVLPGGTTNLLSKALHGDRPAEEIVAGWRQMARIRRNCVRSEAGTAVIEVLAGPGAKWSDVREEMRAADVAAVASTALEAAQASAGNSTVVLTSPRTGKPDGYSGLRLSPSRGGIEVEGYGAATIGEYLAQGMALLRRDFRTGPHDDLGIHSEVTANSVDGTPIELMLDGERDTGEAEMTFSLAELKVDLLSSSDA